MHEKENLKSFHMQFKRTIKNLNQIKRLENNPRTVKTSTGFELGRISSQLFLDF